MNLLRFSPYQPLVPLLLLAAGVAGVSAQTQSHDTNPAAEGDVSGPVAITLLTSSGAQSIAAGTTGVTMARYRIEVGDAVEQLSLASSPFAFEGSREGLSNCILSDGNELEQVLLPESGSTMGDLAEPYQLGPMTTHEFTVRCDIGSDATGRTYVWGIAPLATVMRGRAAPLAVSTKLARQWNGKPGENGRTFTVTRPDRVLNSASLVVGLFPEIGSDAKTALFPDQEIVVRVRALNTGAETWKSGSYKLVPDESDDTKLWATAVAALKKDILPGEEAVFDLLAYVPEDIRTHRLRWYLASSDGNNIIQQPAALSLTVLPPVPLEEVDTEGQPTLFERVKNVLGNTLGIGSAPGAGGGRGGSSGGGSTSAGSQSSRSVSDPFGAGTKSPTDENDDIGQALVRPEAFGSTKVIIEYCDEGQNATEYCDME